MIRAEIGIHKGKDGGETSQREESDLHYAYRTLRVTHAFGRKMLCATELLEPGLVDIGEGLITGWFLVEKEGKIQKAFGSYGKGETVYKDRSISFPYFRMEPNDILSWQNRVRQGHLSQSDVETLDQYSGLGTHPLYPFIQEESDEVLLMNARRTIDSFNKGFNLREKENPLALGSFLKEVIGPLAVMDSIVEARYKQRLIPS